MPPTIGSIKQSNTHSMRVMRPQSQPEVRVIDGEAVGVVAGEENIEQL